MTKKQIDQLISEQAFPGRKGLVELVETLISWVILTPDYAFKIKKNLRFPFLDFSTLALRKHFCEAEIRLNNRFTRGIYLQVLPIRQTGRRVTIGGADGEVLEYAVQMKRLDNRRQMSRLLQSGAVTPENMRQLAQQLAAFHYNTEKINTSFDVPAMQTDFEDILKSRHFAETHLGRSFAATIDRAVAFSAAFLEQHGRRLKERSMHGFFLDGHGDLHSNNIFLLDEPVIFDCIEFNDHLRLLDALNETAFLCMDLHFYGRKDLEEVFMEQYLRDFPCIQTPADRDIFNYFKLYRANVRAKVNLLKNDPDTGKKYLSLMEKYLEGGE